MKFLFKIILPTVLVFLAGCTTTPNEMRAGVKEKGTMKFSIPFTIARHNFLAQAKNCFSRGLRTAYPVHVVNDVKPGEFTTLNIYLTGAPGMEMITHSFDIRKIESGETEVSWFIAGLIVVKHQPVVEYWVNGLEGRCGSISDK